MLIDKKKHGKINAKYNIHARDYTSTLYCYAKQPLREWEKAKKHSIPVVNTSVADPDLLVSRRTDPDQDPSIIKQK